LTPISYEGNIIWVLYVAEDPSGDQLSQRRGLVQVHDGAFLESDLILLPESKSADKPDMQTPAQL
jgi:hypothetical protein